MNRSSWRLTSTRCLKMRWHGWQTSSLQIIQNYEKLTTRCSPDTWRWSKLFSPTKGSTRKPLVHKNQPIVIWHSLVPSEKFTLFVRPPCSDRFRISHINNTARMEKNFVSNWMLIFVSLGFKIKFSLKLQYKYFWCYRKAVDTGFTTRLPVSCCASDHGGTSQSRGKLSEELTSQNQVSNEGKINRTLVWYEEILERTFMWRNWSKVFSCGEFLKSDFRSKWNQ